MSHGKLIRQMTKFGFPRVSGDEPRPGVVQGLEGEFSPRERG